MQRTGSSGQHSPQGHHSTGNTSCKSCSEAATGISPDIAGHPQWWCTPAAPSHPSRTGCCPCAHVSLQTALLAAGIATVAAGRKTTRTCCTSGPLAGVAGPSTSLTHAIDAAAGLQTAVNSILATFVTEAAGTSIVAGSRVAETVSVSKQNGHKPCRIQTPPYQQCIQQSRTVQRLHTSARTHVSVALTYAAAQDNYSATYLQAIGLQALHRLWQCLHGPPKPGLPAPSAAGAAHALQNMLLQPLQLPPSALAAPQLAQQAGDFHLHCCWCSGNSTARPLGVLVLLLAPEAGSA